MPVQVSGGSAGITASVADLQGIALGLRTAEGTVRDVRDDVLAPAIRVAAEVGADRDPVGSLVLEGELDDVGARLQTMGDDIADLTLQVLRAADGYTHVEHGVLDAIGSLLTHVGGGAASILDGDAAHGALQVFGGLPAVVDLLARETRSVAEAVARLDPDGHAVLHDLGPDVRGAATRAPRTLDDLIAGLELRNEGRHGEISVSFVAGVDGRRRAIVDVPGTKSWDPRPNHDITSVGTDVRAIDGQRTSYEDGVLAAMTAAGVGAGDEVMLVGHSEGGIVAVNTARDAVRTGRFRVTHVVTAGSPIGRIAGGVPPSVRVLAIENRADIVPATDGAANPDRRNVVTATVDEQHWSVVGNHDLDATYRPAARAAELSCNESVDEFLGSAAGFLAGGPMRTHAYVITRGF